jgi:hypothetical protein
LDFLQVSRNLFLEFLLDLQNLEFRFLRSRPCKSRSDSASQKRLNYSVALPE